LTKSTDNSQQAIALIKFFSEEKHYLAFKDGCSMFRTPHYYRMREDAGRGDRSESCLGYWDKRLGDKMPSLVSSGRPIDVEDAESVLIYPAHEQQDAWLQSWCVLGPHNEFEQSLEQMLEEFGTYFVVLPAKNISAYANLINQASGYQVSYGLLQYSDNPLNRSLTVKDSIFGYQKEFRFYVGACEKSEIQDKMLHLQGINNILLEANSLKLASPSGEIKYCSLGRKKVVIA
jgi:hypothetical protein